jgi:hypothetical protein
VSPEPRNKIRKLELMAAFGSVDVAIRTWMDAWQARDRTLGRHKTRLEALSSLFDESLQSIGRGLGELDLSQKAEDFYGISRDYEQAIVWLRRLWDYFGLKLDQRLGPPEEADLLRAADEVVWSCYHPTVRDGPAPLAFLAPEYSPAALLSDHPPSTVLPPEVSFLDGFVESLPIPLLLLPVTAVGSPWWLIYAAHEVGHHVQSQLGLSGSFAKGLREAVSTSENYTPSELDQWTRWSSEIFADLFSVVLMGPWAVFSIIEAEFGPAEAMVAPKRLYPAPVTRIAMLHQAAGAIAGKLGEEWPSPLGDLDIQALASSSERTKKDGNALENAIEFSLAAMEKFCVFQKGIFTRQGKVDQWAKALADPNSTRKECAIESARQIAAGSMAAWASYSRQESAAEKGRKQLAARTVSLLIESAAPGNRAAVPPRIEGRGGELAAKLLATARAARAAVLAAGAGES